MQPRVKKVKPLERYTLELEFTNGEIRRIDFEQRLVRAKNMFLPLRDEKFFRQVKADSGTIMWPNGLDICPDTLYEESLSIKHKNKNIAQEPQDSRKSDEISSNLLKNYRNKSKLTQKQLGEALGLPQSMISAIECGNKSIGKVLAKKIAVFFKTDYRKFL